tara:strand:+ start:2305 stop:2508 length:204 start_codon:yes stop_codon:yes gene_type:complete
MSTEVYIDMRENDDGNLYVSKVKVFSVITEPNGFQTKHEHRDVFVEITNKTAEDDLDDTKHITWGDK